jgi:FKBP-type peptidyl-prolyl cis-trans isomerase 2
VNQPSDYQPSATDHPNAISSHQVIKLEYILKIERKVVEHTLEGDPITILTGSAKQLPPGLEALLEGLKPDDSFIASLSLIQGYREYDLKKNQTVPRSSFPANTDLEPG